MTADPVGQQVAAFYDTHGWVDTGDGTSGEDGLFRQFPRGYEHYAEGSARRTQALLAGRTGALLFVGCGDLPDTHVQIAAGFAQVTCLDISQAALAIAAGKLGPRAVCRLESIVGCTLPDAQFDLSFCAHVIYHIDAAEQEAAVRQLLRLTRPGGRIVIIYANPRSVFTLPGEAMRALRPRRRDGAVPPLYYHAHPLGWWRRFGDQAAVRFAPWQAIGSRPARALLRTDAMAALFYRAAGWFEAAWPAAAARLWQYPIVVLDKAG